MLFGEEDDKEEQLFAMEQFDLRVELELSSRMLVIGRLKELIVESWGPSFPIELRGSE